MKEYKLYIIVSIVYYLMSVFIFNTFNLTILERHEKFGWCGLLIAVNFLAFSFKKMSELN
jgi:hypothetical protein